MRARSHILSKEFALVRSKHLHKIGCMHPSLSKDWTLGFPKTGCYRRTINVAIGPFILIRCRLIYAEWHLVNETLAIRVTLGCYDKVDVLLHNISRKYTGTGIHVSASYVSNNRSTVAGHYNKITCARSSSGSGMRGLPRLRAIVAREVNEYSLSRLASLVSHYCKSTQLTAAQATSVVSRISVFSVVAFPLPCTDSSELLSS